MSESPPDPAVGTAEQIVQQADPQLLKKLQPEQRESVLRIVQQTLTSFEGPLPPPQMLAEYDRLIPQGADRLMRLLESQTSHRHVQETRIVSTQTSLPLRGQFIGTGLCVFFGAIGWRLSFTGHDAVAGVLFGTTILGLVTIFVLGRVPKQSSPPSSASRPKGKRKK